MVSGTLLTKFVGVGTTSAFAAAVAVAVRT
mgnify:CR=1 FL=1